MKFFRYHHISRYRAFQSSSVGGFLFEMRSFAILFTLCVMSLGNEEKTESTTPDFIATPITGPFLEDAYLDCLLEAKWQLDDQRFHIRSIRRSYEILCKRGMKMPEFLRLLNVIDDFYNHTAKLVGRKMRNEEESDEKYDPTYKAAFLRLSHCWRDLIEHLDKQKPRYRTEGRIKKMIDEMSTAANTSHDTYYLISELQMNMATTPSKPWNHSRKHDDDDSSSAGLSERR